MINFDASERNFCVVKRQATSTPLQALVLLNDPQYVEASRMIAERVIKESSPDIDARLTRAFRLLTSRYPEPEELALLADMYQEQVSYFRQSPDGAEALLTVGEYARDADLPANEVAAYATVASTIMNFDESFVKR